MNKRIQVPYTHHVFYFIVKKIEVFFYIVITTANLAVTSHRPFWICTNFEGADNIHNKFTISSLFMSLNTVIGVFGVK